MGKRTVLTAGPPKGVVTTSDPFDDTPDYLVYGGNGYIPDPDGDSGFYARPGWSLGINGSPVYSSATAFRAQGGYSHINLDGIAYNFVVMAGKLFRVDNSFATATDVTPAGITISSTPTQRIKFVSLDGQMVVSDGVNKPWIAGSLSSTPITGTYIDYDGAGVAWSAQDITTYSGAIVVLLNAVGGSFARTTIAWSAPGDPSLGYTQPNYDYEWTLEQTGSAPIFAIHGTNVGLYYWRQRSIGLATGALGDSFQTTHTDDAVADNVGSQSPQSIQGFSDRLFFIDQIGRPWMIPLGNAPVPIWQAMRGVVTTNQTAYQSVTALVSTAAIESTLNLYVVAIWSQTPSVSAPCTAMYVFDTITGRYMGSWDVTAPLGTTTSVELLTTFLDSSGRAALIAFGSLADAPATGGYLWSCNALLGTPDQLVIESRASYICTEDLRRLDTEGQNQVWKDNGLIPRRFITTSRLGYSADILWNVDQVTVITGDNAPCAVSINTSYVPTTIEGTPTPSPSNDGTYRLVIGANGLGRGTQVTVAPLTADDQWIWQKTQVIAIPSKAGPQDA